MRLWKKIALEAYWYGSLPYRWWFRRRMTTAGQVPVTILFYHRVADRCPNAWTLSTGEFERQIAWLRQNTDIVSLQEAQRRIASGHNTRPTSCITFDDGYADNCRFALPLLMRHRLPATYFVSMGHVFHGKPFPHDVQVGVPLPVNSIDDLKQMAGNGIEIGLHTRWHADLGQVTDEAQLHDEVVAAGRELADAVSHPVRYFAFPYGLHENLNARAIQLAREAGYLGVCSAYGAYNFPGEDAFHLQRIHADPQWVRFKNWVTIDPRKTAREPQCDVDPIASPSPTEEREFVAN